MAKFRKSLALFLAVVMVITATVSGIVLPAAAEGEEAELTTGVLYSENFEGEAHGWRQSGTAVETVSDGETNHAISMVGSAKTYTGPNFDANIKKGERYIVRLKIKSLCETDGAEDGILFFFYNSTSTDGSPQSMTMSLKANSGYTSAKTTVPKDEYIWIQDVFTASKDASSLHIAFRSSTAGKINLLVDDISVVHCSPETEIVPNGDFEEDGRVGMLTDAYSNRGAQLITEEDGNKALQITTAGLTYFRMQGLRTGRLYEVKLRYKGKMTAASYAAGCNHQVLKKHSTTSSSEWREYHLYVATNNTNHQYIGLYPAANMIIDDLSVREIRMFLPKTADVFLGDTVTLTPEVKPELTTAPKMNWVSSDEAVATVSGGVVTAVAEGTATITLNNASSKAMATTTVTVKAAPVVEEIVLDKTEAEVLVGKTLELTASWLPEDAMEPEIVWASSNNEVATVENGVVTAVAEGDVEITATATGLDIPAAVCQVKVLPLPKATEITLDQTSLSLQEDSTATLTATWLPEEAAPTIVWSSSNEQVVTVVDGELTAIAAGAATITAAAEGLDITPATCRVTVTAKNLIKNGDFENGTAAWAAGTTYIQATGGKDNSGCYNLSYTHDGSANKQFTLRYGGTNLANLKPNTKYVLSFDYKSTGAGFARLSSWTTAIGDTAFTKNGWTKTIADKSDWTHYTLEFTTLDADAIAAASKAYILYLEYVMYGNADGTGTGTFVVDNVALNTAPVTASAVVLDKTAESIATGGSVTLTPSFLPDGAPSTEVSWVSADEAVATVVDGVVTGVSAGATTITATAADLEPVTFKVEVETKTLLSNGDFEAGANSVWDSNDTRIQKGFGKDGSYGFQSERAESNGDWDAGNGQYYKAPLLGKLKPSTTYILSFDYKNTGYGRGQLYVNYNFGTIGENTAWDSNHAYELPAGEIDWRTIIVTFTTPETITTNANWEFNPRSRGRQGVTYYDNFCLVEASTAGIGNVYTDIAVEEGEIAFAPAGASDETETLKDVDAGTQVTVDVSAKEGYLMVPGSLKYTSTVTGQETKILNKELGFNPENFGSDAFSGDTFTFTMPEAGAKVTAEFVPITEQNFAMDTVGTGLRVKGEEYDGIRFLTRMNMAFSFNEIAAQDDVALTVMYQGVEYTVKELGSMLVRTSDGLDADAMTPADAATYWKKSVAYTEGGDMTLLDYTNRYIDFTVVVTKGANVSAEDFEAREYSARGYMILEDAEGQLKTIVCDNVMTNSVNSAKGKVA